LSSSVKKHPIVGYFKAILQHPSSGHSQTLAIRTIAIALNNLDQSYYRISSNTSRASNTSRGSWFTIYILIESHRSALSAHH